MRDEKFGFQALEHRFLVLNQNNSDGLFRVPDNRKFDLSRCLWDLHGPRFAKHPRLQSLMERNELGPMTRGFLDGAAETEAFDHGQFVKVHQSTLLKADALADLMQLSAEGTLKTDATLWDRVGPYPEALVEKVKNHWLWGLLGLFLAVAGLLTYGWKVMGWFG